MRSTSDSRLSKHLRSGLLGATALTMASAMPAMAQGQAAAADNDQGLEEIIVTARRVAENIQDVPVSVSAFSGADLAAQNVQKVQDLGNFTPGMTIRPGSSSPGAMTLSLRGQVQTDVLITLDPSVGTYVDGVYWARAYGLNSDFLDVQSVQVLKGPQGTLFGRNTTGGALLINSNNPDLSETSGRISATYGRFNEFQVTGILNAPLVKDKVGIRLAAQRFSRDGYTDNTSTRATAIAGNTVVREGQPTSPTGRKQDDRDRWNLRGKLEFKPTERFSVLLSGEYFVMDETSPSRHLMLALPTYTAAAGAANIAAAGAACTPGGATNACANTTYATANTAALFAGVVTGNGFATAGAAGLTLLNGEAATMATNPSTVLNNEVPYVYAEAQTYSGTATLETGFGEAKLIAGHRKIETYAGVDLEGSSFAVHFTEGQQYVDQDSIELQVTGKALDDRLDFATGAFYFTEGGSDQSISIVVPALSAATSHFFGIIDNKSVGIYGQFTYRFTDQLSFTGGLRYSEDTKGFETRNNNYNRTTGVTSCSIAGPTSLTLGAEIVGPAQCAFSRSDKFDGVSYTAGLEYKPNDDILLYAKTAKGFRSGGQNLRAPSAIFFLPFNPEIAYAYEIGFKGEFLDRRIRLNLAAYTTDVKNIQRSTLIAQPGGGGLTATILGNAGKARFRGIEADFQAVVAEGFRISASGALIDPKYIRYADLSGDRSFERFESVSKSQFTLAADYSTEVGPAKVNARVDYSWVGKQATGGYNFPANPANAQIVAALTRPSQGLLGARLSADFGSYELAVFGRNLTNDRSYVNNLLVAPVGYISGTRYEPATYGISGTYKF